MIEPTLTEKAAALIAYLDAHAKPVEPNGEPTVAELLQQSRNAHLMYRRALRRYEGGRIVDGNPVAAAEALALSARLRAQAELADPTHADQAWPDDLAAKHPHEALVEFYGDEAKRLIPPKREPAPKPVEEVADGK